MRKNVDVNHLCHHLLLYIPHFCTCYNTFLAIGHGVDNLSKSYLFYNRRILMNIHLWRVVMEAVNLKSFTIIWCKFRKSFPEWYKIIYEEAAFSIKGLFKWFCDVKWFLSIYWICGTFFFWFPSCGLRSWRFLQFCKKPMFTRTRVICFFITKTISLQSAESIWRLMSFFVDVIESGSPDKTTVCSEFRTFKTVQVMNTSWLIERFLLCYRFQWSQCPS